MSVNSEYKHVELTRKIIGSAMKVHRYFGSGFPEIIYHKSLLIELRKIGVNAKSEVEEAVIYEEEIVGKRRIDIIVEDKVLVELKALAVLDDECYNQVLNCLKVFRFEVGLLLNFGKASLEFKRFARYGQY